MRHAIDPANRIGRDGGTSFVFAAVLCAAVLAALFTLRGGPDLLFGKFPTLEPIGIQSP